MANDGQLPIRITGDASSLVAASQQTNAALESNKIKLAELTPEQSANAKALTATGESAKVAEKRIEEGGKAAEKSGLSHRELRAAAHGLGAEFPVLGHLAAMAIHPIGLVVMTAASAFALWKYRVEECTKALAGVELPDISPAKVGEVTSMAEAWKTYKEALEGATKAYASVEAASDRAMKRLEAEAGQQKRLLEARKGLELAELEHQKSTLAPAEYEKRKLDIEDRYEQAGVKADAAKKQDEIYLKMEEAAALRRDAAGKLQASKGIRVGTAKEDAQTEAELEAQAEKSKKDIAERRDWIGAMKDSRDLQGSVLKNIGTDMRMYARYGYGATTPAGRESAIQMEESVIASEQGIVERYNAFLRNKAAREEARKRKMGLVGEAGAEMGKASVIDAETGEAMEDYSGETRTSGSVADINSAARARQAAGRAGEQVKQTLDEIMKIVESGHGVSGELLNRLKQAQAAQAELEKRVKDLEGRAPKI